MSVLQMLFFSFHSHYPRCTIREDPAGKRAYEEARSRLHRNYRTLATLSDVADFRSDPTSSRGEVEMTLVSKQTPSNDYYDDYDDYHYCDYYHYHYHYHNHNHNHNHYHYHPPPGASP